MCQDARSKYNRNLSFKNPIKWLYGSLPNSFHMEGLWAISSFSVTYYDPSRSWLIYYVLGFDHFRLCIPGYFLGIVL